MTLEQRLESSNSSSRTTTDSTLYHATGKRQLLTLTADESELLWQASGDSQQIGEDPQSNVLQVQNLQVTSVSNNRSYTVNSGHLLPTTTTSNNCSHRNYVLVKSIWSWKEQFYIACQPLQPRTDTAMNSRFKHFLMPSSTTDAINIISAKNISAPRIYAKTSDGETYTVINPVA